MHYLLFTTTQCPKCPAFKDFIIKNVKFDGVILDEKSPSFIEQIKKFDVQNAPTLIVLKNDIEVFRTDDVPQLQSFLMQ